MAKPQITESASPIVHIRFLERVTVEEMEEHFRDLMAMAERRSGPVVAIVDVGAVTVNAVLRMRAAEGVETVAEHLGERLHGIAYVADSKTARGVVTAVHWFVRLGFPTKVFATHDEALTWSEELVGDV